MAVVLASCGPQAAAPGPQGPQGTPPAGGTFTAACNSKGIDIPQRAPGMTYLVQCAAKCASDGINVWGSGPYTDDSGICKAAVHAGVLNNDAGGPVQLVFDAGGSSYKGSQQNGVTSQDYTRSTLASFWIKAAPAPQ
jgi:hypothetical protein